MGKGKELPDIESTEKFVPSNWKQLSRKELQKLTQIQRSRYYAYEPPTDVAGIRKSRLRVQEDVKQRKVREKEEMHTHMKWREFQKQDFMMGQLKASEAQNRVDSLRGRYLNKRTNEIKHLISTQPTAIRAVRLQSLLPPIPTRIKFIDNVKKEQRMRIETLLEDSLGIETGRILC